MQIYQGTPDILLSLFKQPKSMSLGYPNMVL